MGSIFRAILGGVPAAIVVGLLFLLMWGLIRVDELPPADDSEQVNISFSRKLQDSAVTNQKVFERPSLDQPPPPPPAIDNTSFEPEVEGVPTVAPDLGADVTIGAGFNPDRDAQPIVRIPPSVSDFERCIRSDDFRIERVTLEFDVTPEGQVTNVQVVDSTDRCYERAAIRAAQKWKYEPKVVDGNPAPRFGVRTTIEFQVGEQ